MLTYKDLICNNCGIDFKRQLKDFRDTGRYFCSKACQNEYRVGNNNPCWRGGKEQTQCVVCGDQFDVWSSDAERRKTCSMECRNVYISEWQKKYNWLIGLRGEDTPNWNGGTSFERYPREFFDIKPQVLERDSYKCQECNSTESLCVHHIDYNKKNNIPKNLIVLCSSCHSKTNFNREQWQKRYEEYALHN